MERPAEVIRRMRTERGLTQAQAGGLAGISPSTWSAIESGRSAEPRPATRARIARALGTLPSAIWRQGPRPLHLHDVEDPRWEQAVRRIGSRLQADGSRRQRLSFGRHLVAVLDRADPGSPDPVSEAGRWDRLWQLGAALTLERPPAPLAIVRGRLVEREPRRLGAARGPATAGAERSSVQPGGTEPGGTEPGGRSAA